MKREELYPALRSVQEEPQTQRQPPQRPREDTSRDAELARRLQQQLDRENAVSASGMIVAQPVTPTELPYKCGACGMTHVVRNVTHGATFDCAVCGAPNQILLGPPRVIVAGRQRFGIVPLPIFCSVM